MFKEKRSAIAQAGGIEAHILGLGHEWTTDEAIKAGRKGGQHPKKKRPVRLV